MSYKICALIPTHNHHHALKGIIKHLKNIDLDIFIVDDGSEKKTQQVLQKLSKDDSAVHLLRLPLNKGKGIAVQKGLRWVSKFGYTHAFQLDADGQHSLEKIQSFLSLSKRNPQALLSGHATYDDSVPLVRRLGRWLTHVWVWIETLSLRVTDSMCGFRIYPVQKTLAVIDNFTIGSRMDFDVEIMVRLFWQGTPVIMSPVQVLYPEGNVSNFDVLRDNLCITKMHTRLFFLMLKNLPKVLRNRPDYKKLDFSQESICWSSMKERGSILGLFFLAACYRLMGRRACMIIGAPIVLYYYMTSTAQRQASKIFLRRVFAYKSQYRKPSVVDGLRHFMNFLGMTLDKFGAWIGHIDRDQIDKNSYEKISQIMATGKGGIFFVSHLGNMEFCRAVACSEHKKRLHVLLHTKNAQRFNKILKLFSPQSHINILEVTDIGPDTILYLKDCVAAGDWVVIAADRVPVSSVSHVSYVPFLGSNAPFSQGPYILASLLGCPVYTVIAVRVGNKYRIFVNLFAKKLSLGRQGKKEKLEDFSRQYAQYLEKYCIDYPYQWFNFFNFWDQGA